MITLSLLIMSLGALADAGVYIEGPISPSIVETPVLLEEVRARLPGLLVTMLPTNTKTGFYKLELKHSKNDAGSHVVFVTLLSPTQDILLKRNLEGANKLETARQIALVVEGVIKRHADALGAILQAQKRPPPKQIETAQPPATPTKWHVGAALTLGTLAESGRTTTGVQIGTYVDPWPSIELGMQAGLHDVLRPANITGTLPDFDLLEWHVVGTAGWRKTQGEFHVRILTGLGLAVNASSTSGTAAMYNSVDAFMILRLAGSVGWEFRPAFELFASLTADFAPSYPNYTLQDQLLLSRGSTVVFAGLGCRYSLF